MDWELFKRWVDELHGVLLYEHQSMNLRKVYTSMSGYYQKHKENSNE